MVRITLENLTKEFDTPSGPEVAVNNMDLTIDHGEFFTFVGPSGCGKSTTLRMIAGLETPTSGDIYFDDEPVTDLTPQQRDIAMVFQNVALYPHMTNRDNMGYGLKVRGQTEEYDEKIEEAAELLEIENLLDKKPGQLSGGQRQRVALGRAIVRDPNLILLDEPMSDLDAELKSSLRVEIQRIHEKIDTTMVYVTHDQEEAMTMSSQVGVMNDGELAQVDPPEQIFNSPTSEFVSQFIGQPSMNIMDGDLNNDEISIEAGNWTIDLDNYQGNVGKSNIEKVGNIKVGFRPRHIELSNNGNTSTPVTSLEVDVWEPIGANYIIHLKDKGGNEIQAVSSDVQALDHGHELNVNKLSKLYLFDGDTGETLGEFHA